MAYKQIHETFWTDPKIRSFNPKKKLLFLYLITNPHSHYSGIYYLPRSVINEETGLMQKEIDNYINEFIEDGLIKYDSYYNIIWVINMVKYQLKKLGSKQKIGVANHFINLHNSELVKEYLIRYAYLEIPYQYPINTLSDDERYPIDTNTKAKEAAKEAAKETVSEIHDLKYPIEYLNEKAKKNYRVETYKDMIKARYKDGYTKENFKKVIDNKIKQWLNDKEWNKFLRPETLFAKKHFDSYLNETETQGGVNLDKYNGYD